MAGNYSRKPASTCLAYVSWSATAKTVQSGKRKAGMKSKGIMRVIFRRAFPKYAYTLSTPVTYAKYLMLIRSSSKGATWNNHFLGRY